VDLRVAAAEHLLVALRGLLAVQGLSSSWKMITSSSAASPVTVTLKKPPPSRSSERRDGTSRPTLR
jgi:hypothetical protein